MGCIFSHTFHQHNENKDNQDNPKKMITKPLTILYLEDNEIYCDILQYILKSYVSSNVTIIWKETVNECYEYLKNNQIDLLFIDRILENNEKGDELIQKINDEKLFDPHKIIIISSLNDIENINEFIKSGMVYFKKPLNTQEFVGSMQTIINSI